MSHKSKSSLRRVHHSKKSSTHTPRDLSEKDTIVKSNVDMVPGSVIREELAESQAQHDNVHQEGTQEQQETQEQ